MRFNILKKQQIYHVIKVYLPRYQKLNERLYHHYSDCKSEFRLWIYCQDCAKLSVGHSRDVVARHLSCLFFLLNLLVSTASNRCLATPAFTSSVPIFLIGAFPLSRLYHRWISPSRLPIYNVIQTKNVFNTRVNLSKNAKQIGFNA